MTSRLQKLALCLVCLTAVLITTHAQETPSPPEFSIDGGIYESPFLLALNGEGKIYYTTDGSVPDTSSQLYTSPISIGERTNEIYGFQGEVTDTIPGASTIRAAVIKNGQSSKVVTQTYFVGSDTASFFGSIPLVNLVVDPYDLWDDHNGIYTNYNYEHKVDAVFQYISTDGQSRINRAAQVKVSGHGSRSAPKKNLRVYFKNLDPEQGKYLEYDLIPGTNMNWQDDDPVTTFSKVTFRVSDWQFTNMRDVVAQEIAKFTRADTASSIPAALFLNGEYWGMYECREQYDEDYVAAHYAIDNDDVVFLDRDWTLEPQYDALSDTGKIYTDKIDYSSGPKDGNKNGRLGESYYRDQWRYIQSLCADRDITDSHIYSEFCALVDVDNLIDYLIVYIFSGNDDWPGNNFKLWRVTEENIDPNKYGADGRWRFMVHDFDIAFESSDHQTLTLSALTKGDVSDARHPAFATAFLEGLLRNDEFRSEFAQRTATYLSTCMSKDNVQKIVDRLVEQRQAAKKADLIKWGWGRPDEDRTARWVENMGSFVKFAGERNSKLRRQYMDVLNNSYSAGIDGEAYFRFVSDSCEFNINGALITKELYGEKALRFSSTQFSGIPVTISANSPDGRPVEIAITHNGVLNTYKNEVSFVPENGLYSVTATPVNDAIEDETVSLSGIARAGRFMTLAIGDRYPITAYASDGSRVLADITFSGECAVIEDGILRAVDKGSGTITVEYNGKTVTAEVMVK